MKKTSVPPVVWVLLGFLFAGIDSNCTIGEVLSSNFTPTAIPDGDPAGITLELGSIPAVASLDHVTLSIAHEWLGDLTVQLIPPSGPALTLFDRAGVTGSNPDGSSAVLGKFTFVNQVGTLVPDTYTFAATGLNLATAAQDAINSNPASLLPSGPAYAAQTWQTGPFVAGTWRILLADHAEFSQGRIGSVELTYTTAVPEVGSTALLLLGMAAMGCRALAAKLADRGAARKVRRIQTEAQLELCARRLSGAAQHHKLL